MVNEVNGLAKLLMVRSNPWLILNTISPIIFSVKAKRIDANGRAYGEWPVGHELYAVLVTLTF